MRLGAKLLRRCILPLVRETDSIIYEAFDFTARQRLGAVLRMKTKKEPGRETGLLRDCLAMICSS
jgi:hypothetical protein